MVKTAHKNSKCIRFSFSQDLIVLLLKKTGTSPVVRLTVWGLSLHLEKERLSRALLMESLLPANLSAEDTLLGSPTIMPSFSSVISELCLDVRRG